MRSRHATKVLRVLPAAHAKLGPCRFTDNPRKRIRQHNGEIQGGAWKTRHGRPWEMVLVVYGFMTQEHALQFEWAWQHPQKSKAARCITQLLPKYQLAGVEGKVRLMHHMLLVAPWRHYPLTLQFLSQDGAQLHAGCPQLPQHMQLVYGSMDSLPTTVDSSEPALDDAAAAGQQGAAAEAGVPDLDLEAYLAGLIPPAAADHVHGGTGSGLLHPDPAISRMKGSGSSGQRVEGPAGNRQGGPVVLLSGDGSGSSSGGGGGEGGAPSPAAGVMLDWSNKGDAVSISSGGSSGRSGSDGLSSGDSSGAGSSSDTGSSSAAATRRRRKRQQAVAAGAAADGDAGVGVVELSSDSDSIEPGISMLGCGAQGPSGSSSQLQQPGGSSRRGPADEAAAAVGTSKAKEVSCSCCGARVHRYLLHCSSCQAPYHLECLAAAFDQQQQQLLTSFDQPQQPAAVDGPSTSQQQQAGVTRTRGAAAAPKRRRGKAAAAADALAAAAAEAPRYCESGCCTCCGAGLRWQGLLLAMHSYADPDAGPKAQRRKRQERKLEGGPGKAKAAAAKPARRKPKAAKEASKDAAATEVAAAGDTNSREAAAAGGGGAARRSRKRPAAAAAVQQAADYGGGGDSEMVVVPAGQSGPSTVEPAAAAAAAVAKPRRRKVAAVAAVDDGTEEAAGAGAADGQAAAAGSKPRRRKAATAAAAAKPAAEDGAVQGDAGKMQRPPGLVVAAAAAAFARAAYGLQPPPAAAPDVDMLGQAASSSPAAAAPAAAGGSQGGAGWSPPADPWWCDDGGDELWQLEQHDPDEQLEQLDQQQQQPQPQQGELLEQHEPDEHWQMEQHQLLGGAAVCHLGSSSPSVSPALSLSPTRAGGGDGSGTDYQLGDPFTTHRHQNHQQQRQQCLDGLEYVLQQQQQHSSGAMECAVQQQQQQQQQHSTGSHLLAGPQQEQQQQRGAWQLRLAAAPPAAVAAAAPHMSRANAHPRVLSPASAAAAAVAAVDLTVEAEDISEAGDVLPAGNRHGIGSMAGQTLPFEGLGDSCMPTGTAGHQGMHSAQPPSQHQQQQQLPQGRAPPHQHVIELSSDSEPEEHLRQQRRYGSPLASAAALTGGWGGDGDSSWQEQPGPTAAAAAGMAAVAAVAAGARGPAADAATARPAVRGSSSSSGGRVAGNSSRQVQGLLEVVGGESPMPLRQRLAMARGNASTRLV